MSAATAPVDGATGALGLVASVVWERPAFAGPERDPAELARSRPEWLLSLLVRVPALRQAARGRAAAPLWEAPAEGVSRAEALCRLLLHPAPGVAAAAAALAEPLLVAGQEAAPEERRVREPADAASGGGNPAKRVKWLERDRAELRRRVRRLTRQLEEAEGERNHARAEAAAVRARVEELAAELDAAERRWELALADLADPRLLAGRLVGVWDAAEPGLADDDHAGRDPRRREHGDLAVDERRLPFHTAARRADLPVEALVAALRALAVPEPEPEAAPPGPVLEVGGTRELRVTQLGGGTGIGGSCVLVETASTRILVDAGLRVADGSSAGPVGLADLDDRRVDAVVVTHAHNDHGGYVPALLAERGPFPVIATPQTADLLSTMWQDTAKISAGRAAVHARHSAAGSAALYDMAAVGQARRALLRLPTGVEHTVGDVVVELFPAGHILGAAGVVLRAGNRRVVVTGDVSGFGQHTVSGYVLPESARGADLLVMESTCCDMDLPSREDGVARLLSTVRDAYGRGGRVLVPAMALGRAQEVAGLLGAHLPEVPVLVDGLAARIARQYEQAAASGEAPAGLFGDRVRMVDARQRAEEIARLRQGVVISPSANLTGGPVVEWARAILPDPNSVVLIPGRTDEESPGGMLERLRDGGGRRLPLDGLGWSEEVAVRARVADMKLSAHADRQGLLDLVAEAAPQRVHLVHGRPSAQRLFGTVLASRGYRWALGVEGRTAVLG
ncbi:MBL fold metallo-hydrolase [Thermobifida cellulosilytica]|uniref:MBL fold metallo-hydrolase n=1 Tax=Thermobifida cellulosilytica TaxID=144786 RepID=UPI000AF2991D|nr:MBL fold metallo-hydrolase [Thermobifida cellulosilytica]